MNHNNDKNDNNKINDDEDDIDDDCERNRMQPNTKFGSRIKCVNRNSMCHSTVQHNAELYGWMDG